MANEVLDLYRKYLADTGQKDDTDDYTLTQQLGQWAQRNNPGWFQAFPGFAQEYGEIREANAPSLGEETWRGVKRGWKGLESTAASGLALLTGSDTLRQKAEEFEQEAASPELAATVPTLEDIAPHRTGIGRLINRDVLRYSAGKLGEVGPSIGEALVTSAGGAMIGSAAGPEGTAAGAATGLVAKGLVKSAIKSLLKKGAGKAWLEKGLLEEASEAALEQAVRRSVPEIADTVGREAMAIGAKRGMEAANLANSYLLNAGDVYSEGGDRPTALALGLASAVPDSILPAYVVSRLFPGVAVKKAEELAKPYIADRAIKVLNAAGLVGTEAATEYFQEGVNVVARNLKEGKDALAFTDDDLKRFREAGIAGAFGGALAAPSSFVTREGTTVQEGGKPIVPPAPDVVPPDELAAVTRARASVAADQQTAREAEAAELLRQQQEEIARQTTPPVTPPAEDLGRTMVGETPELAAEREAKQRAYGMAGAEVPDASSAEQAATAQANQVAQSLVNTPAPEPVLSQEEATALAKRKEVEAAIKTPGVTFQYTVFKPGGGIPDVVQIDVISPDKSQSLASTTLPQLRELGVKLPDVPHDLPQGQYSAEQITQHLLKTAKPVEPTAQPAPSGTAAESRTLPAGSQEPVASAEIPAQATPKPASNADIAEHRRTVKQLGDRIKRLQSTGNYDTANKLRAEWNDAQSKLAGMLASKQTGTRLRVGNGPNGEPDLLTDIENEVGAIKVGGKGGESNDLDRSLSQGIARYLRSKTGRAPDLVVEDLNATGRYNFKSTVELAAAIDFAVANRKKLAASLKLEDYKNRVERAAFTNEGRKRGITPEQGTTIDEIGEGGEMKLFGGKFSVTGMEETPEGTFLYIVEDGHKFRVPEGTVVFPDRGTVKNAKPLSKASAEFITPEVEAAAEKRAAEQQPAKTGTGELFAAEETPFNLASEIQQEPRSTLPQEAPAETQAEMFNIQKVVSIVDPEKSANAAEEIYGDAAKAVAGLERQLAQNDADPVNRRNFGKEQRTKLSEVVALLRQRASPPESRVPYPEATKTPAPFEAGQVVQGGPSRDFRSPALAAQTPQQWAQTIRANIAEGIKGSKEASKSDTRIGVALQSPDGRVILTGATIPARTLSAEGKNVITEPTLQRMGIDQGGKRTVQASGNKPALLSDVVAAGFRPLAVVHFEGEPGKIHQVFPDQQAFDASWTKSGKPQDANIQSPEMRRTPHADAVEAGRSQEFNSVMGNLRNIGMKVDVFGREILAQSSAEELGRRIQQVQAQIQASPDPIVRAELNRRLSVLQERLGAVNDAAGVTYSPWHIAVAADDVGNNSTNSLVTLLHEAAESLGQRLTAQQRGAVSDAVNAALEATRERARQASEQTGVPLSRETGAIDLLAETLAQELAARKIPDAPSMAQAIIRWIKDVYYRTAMALQAAFGAEPSPDLALGWFENQMRREVLGDFSYEYANLLDRYLPSPMQERVRQFSGYRGTPGGIADFVDPVSGRMTQPQVETLNRDALNWNMEFREAGHPGAELEIPDPEARARINGAVLNELGDFYETLRKEVAPEMKPDEFFQIIKRAAEEDPRLLAGLLNEKIADSGNARLGGDRMTNPMNREAQVELWSRFRKLGLATRRKLAYAQRTITEGTKTLTERAGDINRMEADLRNSALHEDRLRERAKELVSELARAYTRGRNTAHIQGALAESIREAEKLRDSDPIPAQYQTVLKSLYDGSTPIFNYMRAIADLDLPLFEMTTKEVLTAIEGNAEHNAELANLARNKPLAVALATLARKNAEQVDQIQLGWLRDTARFRDIHGQLEEIKTATRDGLREMYRQFSEQKKVAGLLGRLKSSYFAKRRAQDALSERIKFAEERSALWEKMLPLIDRRADEMAQASGGSHYEWAPNENAEWTAMTPTEDGKWKAVKRTLHFNPDGSAVDGDQLRKDITANLNWLQEHAADAGTPRYNQIATQTYALKLIDAKGLQQRVWNNVILNGIDRFVRTPVATARTLGGPAMQRVIQMLTRFDFILRSYKKDLEAPAFEWQHEFTRLRNASGLKDNGEFISHVYNPAIYFLATNPGLEEGPARRQVVAYIRRSLPNAQPDFSERFNAFLLKTKEIEHKIQPIAEQYGVFVQDKRLGAELRRAVPKGWLTGMRSLNGGLVDTLTKEMGKLGWKLDYGEENRNGKLVKTNIRPATFAALDPANVTDKAAREAIYAGLANTDSLNALLGRLFTPRVISDWLEPFVRKPGQEPFAHDGEAIPQELVQKAWNETGGNVLAWIDRLGQLVGAKTDREGHDPKALFRLSMLRNLDQLFGHEAKLAYEASQTPDLFDPHGPKPHALMDARVSDLLPPEHVVFETYEPESMHRILARLAYHGAFGRNAKNIAAALRETMDHLQGQKAQYATLASLHTTDAGRAAEAKARGWNYPELKTAERRYREAKEFQTQLQGLLGITANSGPLGDFHKGMALLNFMAGQIVDNPKTAAYNILSPAMRPFAQRSLGPTAITNTIRTYGDILHTGLGSLFESLGLHLFKASRYADTIGHAEGRAFSNLPYGVMLSDIGHAGDAQSGSNRWLVKPLKIARNVQRKGLQLGGGEAREFPRLAPVPGIGVMNSLSQIEVQAGGGRLAQEFEQLVHSGMRYMKEHPDAAGNPSFRFKPSDLYRWKLDHPLLDWWREKATEYNLGNLEDVVRDAAKRQAADPTARLLTEDQALTMSMINQNEFSGNSSVNTTPVWLASNPFLRVVMPLLRWPLWMMSAAHEAAKPRPGENAVKPMLRAIGTMALWNLPIGIAFSLLMDEYDEKLVGRKSNLPNISGTAALPLVGLPATLLTAEHPLSQLESMLIRSARAGNIYGLGADFAASTLGGLDPSTGQRDFSLDQRVLAFSQLMNVKQALKNYMNQGGYATWGSVGRPLLMAIGGNGVLHSVDLTNHLLGLDNAQSRLVQRAAAGNWIRSAAQELDMEVKRGAFAGTPTPMSAATREMYLAALANDRAGFLESYRRALNAAREAVADDNSVRGADREHEAQNRVISSWRSRDPMGVLANKPTDAQVQHLLSIMDASGQQVVRDAMQRFATFSAMIEPTPIERYMYRQQSAQRRQYDPDALRRRMLGGNLLFSTR